MSRCCDGDVAALHSSQLHRYYHGSHTSGKVVESYRNFPPPFSMAWKILGINIGSGKLMSGFWKIIEFAVFQI